MTIELADPQDPSGNDSAPQAVKRLLNAKLFPGDSDDYEIIELESTGGWSYEVRSGSDESLVAVTGLSGSDSTGFAVTSIITCGE